jgi:uncharacterized protein with HEPN domain
MRQPDDRVLLADMADHARRAIGACHGRRREDMETDPILAAALERFIEVIGEAASKVSPVAREQLAEIPWAEITGMRHRLIHGYASVDHDVVWTVVRHDLPLLVAALKAEGRR